MQLDILQSLMACFALVVLGAFLTIALADRFWGWAMFGGIVKPQSKLIYEGRPWWTRRVLMYLFIAVLFTAFTVLSCALFMPLALNDAWQYLGLLWVIMLLASLIAAAEDRSGTEE